MPLRIEGVSERPRPPTASTIGAVRQLRAPPTARPAEHASSPHSYASINPRESQETYSSHTPVHERAVIKRNTDRAPPVRPLFKLGQTQGKNGSAPPLPHLPIHLFLHSSDGFRRAVLRHTSRLGGPPSLPDTSEAARCSTSLA